MEDIISVIALAAVLGAPPAIAIVYGIRWWREIKKSGPLPKVRVAEVVVFLLALVPGTFGLITAILDGHALAYRIPAFSAVIFMMSGGAVLRWLYAHSRKKLPARQDGRPRKNVPGRWLAGKMLIGVLYSLPSCFILLAVIPNLIPAKRCGNETLAVTSLMMYAHAQRTYYKMDYDGDGINEYASDLGDLYDWDGPGGEKPIKLIDIAMARAEMEVFPTRGSDPEDGYDGECRPRSGYFFADIPHRAKSAADREYNVADGDKPPLGWLDGFALAAFPERYNRTGIKTFVVTDAGDVYEKIIADCDASRTELLPDHVPDFEQEGWLLVGQ